MSPCPRVPASPRQILLAPSPNRPLASHPSPLAPRSAFSLVEMMIAIMILGLGMVMAATVFPVSLDMTKGTLQINISQTAADVAAATLAIRVPKYEEYVVNANNDERVSFPNMHTRELYPNVDYDYGGSLVPLADLDTYDVIAGSVITPPNTTVEVLRRVRLFTELTFWDAEASTLAQISAYVIAAQNMKANLNVVAEMPPMPNAGYQSFPRISIADRVYPPVDLYRVDGTVRPLLNSDPNDLGVLDEISSRRYCWTALHYKDLHDLTRSGYYCQIAVLYRSNLDGRYIRQNTATAGNNAPQPEPTNGNDTLFPQAWLVTVDMNGPTGVIRCTSNVAAMLPEGSYIITADTVIGSPGAFSKILKNNWQGQMTDPDVPSTWATLQIKPGEFSENGAMRIWVFPPAIQSAPTGGRSLDVYPDPDSRNVQFETVSPVVDVVPKKVNAG